MKESPTQHISYSLEGGVGTLTLRRPPLNILNIAMLREMRSALRQAEAASGLKVLLLAAEGKAFSAGVDVAEHTPEKVGEMIPLFHETCRALAEFSYPTVAKVHGHALGGGCELAICCDFVFMTRGARIGQPEIELAALAPVAALRLPQMVGARWAARLLLSGEILEADQAAAVGLITQAVAAEDLNPVVDAALSRLAGLSAAALRLNKRSARMGMASWVEALPGIERLYLQELMATEDAREGVQAFLEKRRPVWKDR